MSKEIEFMVSDRIAHDMEAVARETGFTIDQLASDSLEYWHAVVWLGIEPDGELAARREVIRAAYAKIQRKGGGK